MNNFELYGQLAEKAASPIMMSGRYVFQADAARHIPEDVIAKLQPKPTDRLLDIGCNIGLLLNHLAPLVGEAVGMDHPNLLKKYQEAGVPRNVRLLPGAWPATKPEGTFNIVIAYGVLNCLVEASAAREFIQRCVDVLRPSGALLLGDLPNQDARRRFCESTDGRVFDQAWSELKVRHHQDHAVVNDVFANAQGSAGAYVNDAFVLELLADVRRQGLESYVLPQGRALPFSFTREDILIRKRS